MGMAERLRAHGRAHPRALSGFRPAAARSSTPSRQLGQPGHVRLAPSSSTSSSRGRPSGRPVSRSRRNACPTTMEAYGFRVRERRQAARLLRRLGPDRRARGPRARRRPLRLRGDARAIRQGRRAPRPPLRRRGARRGGRPGHPRTGRSSSQSPDGVRMATDGLVVDVSGDAGFDNPPPPVA